MAIFLSGYADLGVSRIYLTNLSFNENTNLIDVTDLSVTLGETEFVEDKRVGSFSTEGWLDVFTAPPNRGDLLSVVLDFEGYQVSGDARVTTINIDAVLDAAIRLTFSGKFTEAIAITPDTL